MLMARRIDKTCNIKVRNHGKGINPLVKDHVSQTIKYANITASDASETSYAQPGTLL
jgi:hypothetical protein